MAVMWHGQTAKAVDQINQATVLFIDVVQSGDEGGGPFTGKPGVFSRQFCKRTDP